MGPLGPRNSSFSSIFLFWGTLLGSEHPGFSILPLNTSPLPRETHLKWANKASSPPSEGENGLCFLRVPFSGLVQRSKPAIHTPPRGIDQRKGRLPGGAAGLGGHLGRESRLDGVQGTPVQRTNYTNAYIYIYIYIDILHPVLRIWEWVLFYGLYGSNIRR